MAYIQKPKSPLMKALVGKQKNLPQHLREKILAAPESTAKQTMRLQKMKTVEKPGLRAMKTVEKHKMKKEIAPMPEKPVKLPAKPIPSVAKQTTAGEFAYEKSLKDKEMGKSTKVIDKFTSALQAPFSDKTYAELKKEKRAAQKKKYAAEHPESVAKKACWDSHKMVGMKNKGGKQVPNCVPKK